MNQIGKLLQPNTIFSKSPYPLSSLLMSLATTKPYKYKKTRELNLTYACPTETKSSMSGCSTGDLISLFKLMKEALPPAHMVNVNDLKITNETDLLELEKKAALLPMIPYCQLANSWSSGQLLGIFDDQSPFHEMCTIFSPTLTDQGICHGFNGQTIREQFHRTDYLDAFQEVFQNSKSRERWKVDGIRIKNGLRLIMDAHVVDSSYKHLAKDDNTFQISLQHPEDFQMPMLSGVTIEGGRWYR